MLKKTFLFILLIFNNLLVFGQYADSHQNLAPYPTNQRLSWQNNIEFCDNLNDTKGFVIKEQVKGAYLNEEFSSSYLNEKNKNEQEIYQLAQSVTAGDNYINQIKGYLMPAVTGEYTFWVTGDEEVILYLSPDKNPKNKEKIASLSEPTRPSERQKFTTQTSKKIHLEAGKSYYIEVFHKETEGRDYFYVYWQEPTSQEAEIIDGKYLAPMDKLKNGFRDMKESFLVDSSVLPTKKIGLNL